MSGCMLSSVILLHPVVFNVVSGSHGLPSLSVWSVWSQIILVVGLDLRTLIYPADLTTILVQAHTFEVYSCM